ncbi:hypothetical protein Gpo141_00014386, partial [Globisporangium polare]
MNPFAGVVPFDLSPVNAAQYKEMMRSIDAVYTNERNIASVRRIVRDKLAPMYDDILQHHEQQQHVSIAFASGLRSLLDDVQRFQHENAGSSKL